MTMFAAAAAAACSLLSAPAFARLPDAVGKGVDVAPVAGPTSLLTSLEEEAPDRTIPPAVGREVMFMPASPAAFAVDPSQVHGRTIGAHSLYVAPMKDGLCVFIEDGSSACSRDLDQIANKGLWLASVPPTPGRIDVNRPPSGLIGSGVSTVYGVAPDGVQAVDAITGTGRRVTGRVEDNAFVIVTDQPVVSVALRP